MGTAQASDQFLAQSSKRHGVNTVANGLVRDGAMGSSGRMSLSVSASGRATSARSETDAALKNEHGFHRQLGPAAGFEVRPASRIPAARTSFGQAP